MISRGYSRRDFDHSPFVIFYELTQACDLVCRHCRACAQPARHPEELRAEQARQLLDQLASFPKPPLVVLTGGDPLKRPDVFDLVRYGVVAGLEIAMTPSATPLVTRDALCRLRDAGLSRLAVSLDGADAATHDGLRGVAGSFDRTLEILGDGRREGLPLQVNTTITQLNADQVDRIADLLAPQGIALWSVFFLIPVGRGDQLGRIEPEQYEAVFQRLWHHARHQPYAIKTTEAPHYRRFVLQQRGDPQGGPPAAPTDHRQRAPLGVNDGKGVMFISHTGRLFPSGFLPIECGRFPYDSVVDIYQRSDTFCRLRDPDQLLGKCGRCEFRHACGGSRARAYAVAGDPLAEEPDCYYQPSADRRIPAA
jgi:AdoMet-dependent heme synthase